MTEKKNKQSDNKATFSNLVQKEMEKSKVPAKEVTDKIHEKVPLADDSQNVVAKIKRTITLKNGVIAVFFRRCSNALLNDQISIAIIVGVLGLALGVCLFTSGDRPYGEISLDKRQVIDTLLNDRAACLKISKKTLEDKITALKPAKASPAKKTADGPNATKGSKTDAATSTTTGTSLVSEAEKELKKQLDRTNAALQNTLREKQSFDFGNSDTSLIYFNKYVLVNRNIYAFQVDSGIWLKGKQRLYKSVPLTITDTCRLCGSYPIAKPSVLFLYQNKRKDAIDFFKDYPQFGLWIVFSIAQMVLWFIILPLLFGNIQNLNEKLISSNFKIQFWQVLANTILPMILIGIFCYLFYVKLLDKQIITDDYFFSNFTSTAVFYAIIGYSVASVCMGTFLSLTHKLDKINNITKSKITRIEDPALNAAYIALKKAFDNSFLCSALILSFCVLWTGIMVNAVNSTEAFKFYYIISGKYFIPNDFVYLLGLMHTLILLIFYVPVKLKFNNLVITQDATTTTMGNDGTLTPSPTKTVFSTFSDSIGPLLITASPLLASLIHSLLNLVSKN